MVAAPAVDRVAVSADKNQSKSDTVSIVSLFVLAVFTNYFIYVTIIYTGLTVDTVFNQAVLLEQTYRYGHEISAI